MAIGETVGIMLSNLGVTLPIIVLVITALGSLIFMAVELRLGLMTLFFMYAVEFLAFWRYGVTGTDLTFTAMALLSSFVLMTLSLLLVKSKQGNYGGIL